MTEKIKLFENATFMHEGKMHVVTKTRFVENKAMIFTNVKTFVMYENELDMLLSIIEFVKPDLNLQREKYVEVYVSKTSKEVEEVNALSKRVSTKLEEVFNELATSNYDENLAKKADAMVRASNAIVVNEMMRFKYLTLK